MFIEAGTKAYFIPIPPLSLARASTMPQGRETMIIALLMVDMLMLHYVLSLIQHATHHKIESSRSGLLLDCLNAI